MDDVVDLQLNFAICHFQHKQEKHAESSKNSSPNENESESIEEVEVQTPSNSNSYIAPLQESTISSASTNNTDICVLDSQYDLHFGDDDDEVFLRPADEEDFTVLRKPVKSRRICNCEQSTEVLMVIDSEYQEKHKPTNSGTDSDVEVLMSDWSSGNNEGKNEKSFAFETEQDLKDDVSSCSKMSPKKSESSTDSDVSCAELLGDYVDNTFKDLNRAQLLQIIQQQEVRIQALEEVVERYQKAQQRLFEHVDALRLELSGIRISPLKVSEIATPTD